VIDWFNQHGKLDQVVYMPESFPYTAKSSPSQGQDSKLFNEFIPMYTRLNVYYAGQGAVSLLPAGYDKYNLFLTFKLLNVPPDQAAEYLLSDNTMLGVLYGGYFKYRGQTFQDVPGTWLADIQKNYADFYKLSWPQILDEYQLDYIVWDKNDLPDLPIDQIAKESDFHSVYESGGVVIYQR